MWGAAARWWRRRWGWRGRGRRGRRWWWRRRWGWRRRRRRRRGWGRRWWSRRRVVSQRHEAVLGAVEDVLVAREVDGLVAPLPEGVRTPASRELTRGTAPAGDPQRVVGAEAGVVAGTQPPPVGGRID